MCFKSCGLPKFSEDILLNLCIECIVCVRCDYIVCHLITGRARVGVNTICDPGGITNLMNGLLVIKCNVHIAYLPLFICEEDKSLVPVVGQLGYPPLQLLRQLLVCQGARN